MKQKTRGFIRHLTKPLGLRGWKIVLTVRPEKDLQNADSAMESAIHYEYKFLDIVISKDLKANDKDLYTYTVHELNHALIEPLSRVAMHLAGNDSAKQKIVVDAEESVVTHLTDVITRLIPEKKDAKV